MRQLETRDIQLSKNKYKNKNKNKKRNCFKTLNKVYKLTLSEASDMPISGN